MNRHSVFAIVVTASLAGGCSGSPTSPSMSSNLAAQTAVMSAMGQAMSQLALAGRTSGDTLNTFTIACPGGGSIVTTLDPLPAQQPDLHRFSSRTEFNDCKNQGGTLNGDPYLQTSAEHLFPTAALAGGDSISTLRTTGGVRLDSNGVLSRVKFDCTMIVNVQSVASGSPQISMTWSGTTTFEQPIGSTPVVRPCGPA